MDLYGVAENQNQQPQVKPTKKFQKPSLKFGKPSRKQAGILVFIFAVLVIGGGAYVYKNQDSDSPLGDVAGVNQEQKAEEEVQKENAEMLEKVAELTLISMDETPEFAEIADTTKLDDQAFFQRAQNGDKVIIFRISKRVVLYRPSTNQIIETGPLVEPTTAPEIPTEQ